jgi:hypothetical protein
MKHFYEELNWPEIPIDFCVTNENYMINNFQHSHPYPDYPFYRQYKNNDNTLRKKLQPLFDFDITGRIFYQIIKKGISTHKDVGRKIIYNYILDAGGDQVYTNFYAEDKTTELFSVKIPAHTWHKMDVSFFHNVVGIETPRVAISVYKSY